MGLFGGLIKDSPATFAINGFRAQKGRMAKRKRKRRVDQRWPEVTQIDFEPRHVTARRYSHYAFGVALILGVGGNLAGAVALAGMGVGFLGLEQILQRRKRTKQDQA